MSHGNRRHPNPGDPKTSEASFWANVKTLKIMTLCYSCVNLLRTAYCVLCTVYCVLCTAVLRTVYCVLCTVYCVLCTVYCVLCTVYCVLCTVYCVLQYCVLRIKVVLKTLFPEPDT